VQLDRNAALESAGANFWSLQIGDDGDRFFVVSGSTADSRYAGGVFFGSTVRKI
jgi:hypothetical protein